MFFSSIVYLNCNFKLIGDIKSKLFAFYYYTFLYIYNKVLIMRSIPIVLLLFSAFFAFSQQGGDMNTRNGEMLPAHGAFRILLVFIEIEYPNGTDKFTSEVGEYWKPGKYPSWANELFDTGPGKSKGLGTCYYNESSFGNFRVYADILLNPENLSAPFVYKSDGRVDAGALINSIWEKGFLTQSNLPADSFNLWKKSKAGVVKVKSDSSDLMCFDHIMFIVRNSTYPGNLAGYASAGNLSAKGPVKTDTYSVFSTRNANPIHIMLHEFNHLLLGGNNVHCCGGNHAASGPQFFMSFQGGWGMMGAANKSLMTCNGWDRYKLGWKPSCKKWFISAINEGGEEVKTDFDFTSGKCMDTVLVIRDFVKYGDAIRIRLPGIPANEYQQWLWIENHQTQSFNGSPFDVFQYQSSGCSGVAAPGLYAYIQVAHNAIDGKNAFSDPADFVRVLPASGMYDIQWGDTMVRNNWCVGNGLFYPFERKYSYRNPLSGNSVSEIIAFDNNGDGRIAENEKREPAIEKVGAEYRNNLPYLGEAGFSFRKSNNAKIGISTNPSTANTLTLLNDDRLVNKGTAPDNRIIYLNSVSVEIVKENYPNRGDITVRVRNGDNLVSGNVRWCAPRIVLPKLASDNEYDLVLGEKSRLTLDIGYTPTYTDSSIVVSGVRCFTSTTRFEMLPGTRMYLSPKSKLVLKNRSVFYIPPGAELIVAKGAKIVVSDDSKIINEGIITQLE
ncbi:MAG: hypothetical protein CVU11_02110 [Bacteroidetes bacterium HGW-Bacteroidetes-6]|jgi:hypothetical protein|nr:MAG: hypothetical protein CVU11_02110 [Bacteroidetes bacterium HGW-Bacteroidetes-6]